MSLLAIILTIIVIIYMRASSETLICDETICDFGTCTWSKCVDNQYICTDKALTCKLQCNSNCNNITMTSYAHHTEIICNKDASCNGVSILIPSPNNALYLECKKSESCSNINIQCNQDTIYQCTDYEYSSQCTYNVHIDWTENKEEEEKKEPSDIITTTTTKIKSTYKPTSNEMENTVETKETHKEVIFVKETTSNSNTYKPDTLTIILIFVAIIWITICIVIPIYMKILKTKDIINRAEGDMQRLKNDTIAIHKLKYNVCQQVPNIATPEYTTPKTAEGHICKPAKLEMVLSGSGDDEEEEENDGDDDKKYDNDNGLYEGTKPIQNIGETPDGDIKILTMMHTQYAMGLDLPQSPISSGSLDVTASLPDDKIIGSLSCDDLDLLYGPGKFNNKQTPNGLYLD